MIQCPTCAETYAGNPVVCPLCGAPLEKPPSGTEPSAPRPPRKSQHWSILLWCSPILLGAVALFTLEQIGHYRAGYYARELKRLKATHERQRLERERLRGQATPRPTHTDGMPAPDNRHD